MQIEDKLDNILDLLKNIEKRIQVIEQQLGNIDGIKTDCVKMRDHIVFIEDTYEIVRSPLNYLKEKIELVMGLPNENELRAITN